MFQWPDPGEDDGVSPAADKVGMLDQALLGEWLPQQRDVDAYVLGPKGFMGAIKRHLKALGVPEQQSRYEFFGPATVLDEDEVATPAAPIVEPPAPREGELSVEFLPSGKRSTIRTAAMIRSVSSPGPGVTRIVAGAWGRGTPPP